MIRDSKWAWRAELTPEEEAAVVRWEAAQARLRVAQREVQALGHGYALIRQRASERAKTRLAKSAAAAPGCVRPLGKGPK